MFKNLKLSQQALILLLVPLVCEILFVSALGMQLHEFDLLLHEINTSRQFGAALNELMDNIGQLAHKVDDIKDIDDGRTSAKIGPEYFGEIRKRSETIDDQLTLLSNTAPTPQLKEKVDRAAVPIRKINKIINLSLDVYDKGGALALFALMRGHDKADQQKFVRLRASLATTLSDLLSAKHEQQVDFDAKIVREEQGFKRLLVIIAVGGVAHIALALLLWINFSRGTAENFRLLVDNTRRLAAGQPLNPRIDGKDEIAHLDHVFNDMAEALAEAKRRDKEIEQMKQEFVAMISHDLRTPLTSVQACLSLLTTGMYGELNDQGVESVTMASSNVSRLISLINELLDIEKMESGKLKIELADAQLSDVLDRTAASLVGFAQQQGIHLVFEPTALQVSADADRLVQVLVNLVSNAIKFSRSGQTVTIKCEENPDSIVVSVADQGRGIPAEFRNAIFERFEQVKLSDAKVKGGSGLGLAICKAIIEGHGGTIGVDSVEGAGSTFWFRLPKQSLTTSETGGTVRKLDRVT